ncbi:hypothetical protein [Pseudomonas mandelii]|uniref:hypothetical protein n=1 Tax=Pseudomonas mandelii TaxID=75612 RepID=UPI00224B9937|nr:hypothetical protein [Pseudomonas mandelii]MCX2896666.1 hypothetical protein [Pseudomonas mandelii]
MNRRLVLLCSAVLLSQPTQAGSDEDKVAADIALKSAEAYAKNQMAEYFNKTVATTLPVGVGTTIFSSIDLGTAAYDFSRADNDKQRAYAGSRASLAAYTLLGGPAAPALAAALLVASVLEAGMQAGHQAKMLEIYNDIQDNYTRVIEIQNISNNVAWINLRYLIATSTGSLGAYSNSLEYFRKNCADTNIVKNLEDLDACISALGRALFSMQLFIDSVNGIDSWGGSNKPLSGLIGKVPGLDIEDLHKKRSQAESVLVEAKDRYKVAIDFYSVAVADLLYKEGISQPPFSTEEWIRMTCTEAAMEHAREGAKLILQRDALNEHISTLQLNAYLRGVESFQHSMCMSSEVIDPSSTYFSRINIWNSIISGNVSRLNASPES